MFFAGADSTISTIEWAMAELLREPVAMQKLQAELDTVVGPSRMVEEADISKLKYLKAIVNETFRLHPIAPLLLPHSNIKPTQIDGYDVPPSSVVMVNTWAISRDPSLWDEPTQFNPDRFITMDRDISYKGHDFELLPFGAGRRKCPGMQLAALMLHMILARLVHGFHWSLPDGMSSKEMDMSEASGLNARMKTPLERVCCEARFPMGAY